MEIYTLDDLLTDIEKKWPSPSRDRGTLFEQVCLIYFKSEPMYKQMFSDVWMLRDVPKEYGIPRRDMGIDLIAKDRITSELIGIQCKYYAPGTKISKGMIDSFLNEIGKAYYKSGFIVSTSSEWSQSAEDSLRDRSKEIIRVGGDDLLQSQIDWKAFAPSEDPKVQLKNRKSPRPHQRLAIDSVLAGFKEDDRGKLIMAPGTGKTYTSLVIAEEMAAEKEGQFKVLYLVPSIQLLSQSLREWTGDATKTIDTIAVCSDRKVTKQASENEEFDISIADIGYPATTDSSRLLAYMHNIEGKDDEADILVVFSTYQSIEVISNAQYEGFHEFDLIICDEAHRTTGSTKMGEEATFFVQVHDNDKVRGRKRLYQTATPRVYGESAKAKADEMSIVIADMNDETMFGKEFYRLGFGEAVRKDILSDYKVIVLSVSEIMVQREMQQVLASKDSELEFDDVTKIIGCWNGLLKRRSFSSNLYGEPMKRAIAFTNTIANSKLITKAFETVVDEYLGQDNPNAFKVEIKHADGSMNALQKNEKINWLKSYVPDKICRILSNAKFLTEGVDVPDLDAVLFLQPRKSKIDIAQAVGRVMRKSPGKEYGYVILPIGVPSGREAHTVLDNNDKYRAVWDVLNALRSIDERFDATINKMELNKKKPSQIDVIGIGNKPEPGENGEYQITEKVEQTELVFTDEELKNIEKNIYGKIVEKVGNTRYWETWSKDVTEIAQQHITRITTLVNNIQESKKAFNEFLKGLHNNINDSISKEQAIEMVAQHLITKPVFNALFEQESFALNNPISRSMDKIIAILVDFGLDKEQQQLQGFYDSVQIRAEGIDNLEAKQDIIKQLYEKFFKVGFPNTTEKLGIVFTPIEVVDFIIHSVEDALKNHLGSTLNDHNVKILDPFTGTGTFIARLLQSGLISKEELLYKYTNEIFANEIVLLSYYIAAINIEETFKELSEDNEYVPFEGITLTDTFELGERQPTLDDSIFASNNQRIIRQQDTPITVIIGNPPYSMGQGSANDDNENIKYEKLDYEITKTYVKYSSASALNSLFDSYIRAFRWASDRIKNSGVVGFVSNASFLDSRATSGFRKCIYEEYNYIYVFNLRGNQRTKGEVSRKEGGKIFGSGSRTPIAITILVKDGSANHKIYYKDIGDYLNREEKLEIIKKFGTISEIEWTTIVPDSHNDWLNKRKGEYQAFTPLLEKDKMSIFYDQYTGVTTSRDAWITGFSQTKVMQNISNMIHFYNKEIDRLSQKYDSNIYNFASKDKSKIKWSSELINRFNKRMKLDVELGDIIITTYRPFTKKYMLYNQDLLHRSSRYEHIQGKIPRTLYVLGQGEETAFSSLMIDYLPNQHLIASGKGFPRYKGTDSYGKIPNISPESLKKLGLDEDDVQFYIYGVLHSPEYNKKFQNDLRKEFPRIPKLKNKSEFTSAGKKLAELHLKYEDVPAFPGVNIEAKSNPSYRVNKMRYGKRIEKGKKIDDYSTIIFNSDITIKNIPEVAQEYMVNGRSAIGWIMESYRVKTDTASEITDDPNDYSDDPKYIFNLLLSIINVSMQTLEIVNSIPKMDIIEE